MEVTEQKQIARAILTGMAKERGIEFVIGQYKLIRTEGIPMVPAAIMSTYTVEKVGHESLIPKVLKHYQFFLEKTGNDIAAAYLAVTASEYEVANPAYYEQTRAGVVDSFDGLEERVE